MTSCVHCRGTGKLPEFTDDKGKVWPALQCPCCGGDGKEPTLAQVMQYAWRKAGRQKEPVTVADAMKRFKCEKEKIFKVVGFCGDFGSPYFWINGAPDMAPEKLEFDFDGE